MQTVRTTLLLRQISKGLLAFFLWGLLSLSGWAEAKQTMVATRVWPAEDYTRIALESGQAFNVSMHQLQNPNRIVLDMHDAVLDAKLQQVTKQVALNDPFIKRIRLGNFKPGVVRLVVDLKQPAKPKVFSIKPVAGYQHRLVLDLFPVNEDSLMAMLETKGKAQPKVIRKPVPKPTNSNRVVPPRKLMVAIDAGHGGEDPGASGATGSREKVITLKIAKKLKRLIDKQPNMRAELVRKGDYYIPLKGRVLKARKMQADIFVSIHADAFTKESAHGSGVYVLSEKGAASSKFAAQLAKEANAADLIGGFDLKNTEDLNLERTLIDLMRTATINDSLKLGRKVLGEIGKINHLHKKRVEHANFVVLKAPDIPSILVETAFLSNRAEERKLRSSKYQQKMAASIFKGIKAYFKTNPGLARIKSEQTLAASK